MITKEYYASPTASRFHNSDADVRYIEGPVGSGKSTACIMECIKIAMMQQPDADNVRKARIGIIRATNPQLRSTTIKTFEMWVPNSVAPVVMTAPISAKMRQRLADGSTLECEFVFLALDEAADVEKLTSLELTIAYINEVREIEHVHFETLQGRIGRYPQTVKDKVTGEVIYGPTRVCVIMDSNPPKTTHWVHELFHSGTPPEGFEMFVQPPAVIWVEDKTLPAEGYWKINEDAENLDHLPDGYYSRQLKGASDEYIRVMLAGEPGMSAAGKAVYPTYSERRHVASTMLNPVRGLPLIIGLDFGLMPAAALMQLTHRGIRILDELPASDESLEDFLADYLRPLLTSRYPGYQIVGSGDPAGRGRSGLDKRTPFDLLVDAGIKAYPAATNNFITRKETVEWFMRREEGMLISPHCQITREAFGGGYVYKELRNGSGRYALKADKNFYSHIMDAVQYGALWARYGYTNTKQASAPKGRKFLFV